MSQEIMHIVANSVDILYVKKSCVNNCNKCLELEIKLFKKKDLVEKEAYDKLVKSYSNLEKHCISLELAAQLNQEIFQWENSGENLNAPTFNQLFKINELKAQSQEKDTIIRKDNRDAHEVYIEKTIEYADTLPRFVEHARTQYPSEPLLEYACMFTKHVQELLVCTSQTCPNSPKPSEKLVTVTPINKDKRVRFAKPVTSLSNISKQTDSLKTKDSNKPLLTSTGVKPTTSASGSKPSGNTKNNRSLREQPRSNQNNKVEDHHRKQCMFDANHDVCFLDFVNDVNMHAKSKSKSKKSQVHNIWKPTGKVFTDIGLKWKPTGRLFAIVVETPKPEIKVYSRRSKEIKSVDIPSSSSLVNDRFSRLFSDISTLDLAKDGLARGIPKLKFQKYHLCSACALGKSKKSSHRPKDEDTIQEKLYILHMDLCGPMRVESINGKKYILVIVDDYSRFTWVRFLRSMDEPRDAIIKCIKNIQVRLNATVRNV
ncbi:retrovirus-related pol polyprotein from transposon TNT 1-94 [Tanacetum coccineum]|uniref:Retrovirus-related pol polyprotein from transposon TNT 1-94 n=1 Tax=Tanacetum coccineum TaxID=301880 RepID=A0ABQ4X8L5_9ASTR